MKISKIAMQKKIKLQPVPPSMPPEALLLTKNRTDSASDGIDGGTGCNFIFFIYLFLRRRCPGHTV